MIQPQTFEQLANLLAARNDLFVKFAVKEGIVTMTIQGADSGPKVFVVKDDTVTRRD